MLAPTPSPVVNTYSPYFVCFSAAMLFFYVFIQMQMFNSIGIDLMQDLHINATQLGYLSASYSVADVIFLLPAGILLDCYSTRKIILISAAFCIVSTLFFAMATTFTFAYLSHFLAGISDALCFLACMYLSSCWFPPNKIALVVGSIVAIGMLGGIVAQTPLAILKLKIGWRNALLCDAGAGILIAFLIWRNVYDAPSNDKEYFFQEHRQLREIDYINSIKIVLLNKQNWLCGICASLLNLPIMLLCALWGNLYLTQAKCLTIVQATHIVSAIFAGNIIGAPTLGWLSDYLDGRCLVIAWSALFSTIIIFMIIPTRNFYLSIILFFTLGFFTSAQILSYPLIIEKSSTMLTNASIGFSSILIMVGGALFQPLFGWIMDFHWDGLMRDGLKIYSVEAYNAAIKIFPLAFIVSIIAAFFIQEKQNKVRC